MQEMAEGEEGDYEEAPQQKSGGLFSGFGFASKSKGKAKMSKKSDAYSAQLFQASKMSNNVFMKGKKKGGEMD